MKIKLLILLFFSLFIINPINAQDEKKVIRVGISNQNFSNWEFTSTNLISENMIKIIDMSSNNPLEPIEANKRVGIVFNNGLYNIIVDNKLMYENLQSPLLFSSNAPIGLVDLNRKGTPAKYLGMIEIKTSKTNKGFNIINVIDMQNYLKGVVPNEMPVSFGLEALKAQSVAARNYATNAQISPNYDVVDSTASQVYYGFNSYKDITNKAIDETQGIYATYKGSPITALYFSTSAGITDDWDDVFADGNNYGLHPYLKARYDNFNQKPLKDEKDVIDFYSRKDTGYDTISPKFRWEVEFERGELEAILNSTLIQQSKAGLVEPKFDGSKPIENIKEIKPLKRTQSGKVVELLISSQTGDYKIKKELGIRRVLRKNNAILPSANFFIQTLGNNSEIKNKIIGIFDIDEKYPEKFKFIGGGFGHGVGMSQFGAYALAKSGKKYPEILNHYYSDINISTIPKTVLYNEFDVWYKTEFYFDNNTFKTVNLYINNHKNATEFNFKINDYELNNTNEFAHNKLIKIDITQYLKKGMNTISFAPLTRENKGKIVTYQVEFK